MLPVENTTYGRVADIHRLLPESGLHIIDEAFVRVHINLLGVPGAKLADVKEAWSATSSCCRNARASCANTASPAASAPTTPAPPATSPRRATRRKAALASELAGEIYGLDVLARHIEDHDTNTTRFLIMSREADMTRRADHMMTTFVFRVRNIPAALYKAMGGFATNGVNMTKLESYMVDGSFTATQFYADIEGHPDDRPCSWRWRSWSISPLPEGPRHLPRRPRPRPLWALGALILAGLLGGVGQILLTSSYRFADASLIAPFEYASMLLAIGVGYFVFSEVPTGTMLTGAGMIVTAGVLIIWRERQLGLERARQRKAGPGHP
jgi:prephenate dehydratase